MFKICLLLASLLFVVFCMPSEGDTDSSKSCHHNGFHFKEGEEVPAPIGECSLMRCVKAKQNIYATEHCLVFDVYEPCNIIQEEDLTKPYPECCRKVVCPEGAK